MNSIHVHCTCITIWIINACNFIHTNLGSWYLIRMWICRQMTHLNTLSIKSMTRSKHSKLKLSSSHYSKDNCLLEKVDRLWRPFLGGERVSFFADRIFLGWYCCRFHLCTFIPHVSFYSCSFMLLQLIQIYIVQCTILYTYRYIMCKGLLFRSSN